MAKQSGIGSNLYVAQFDVSGDIGAIGSIDTSRALLDLTDITESGFERTVGRRDGQITFSSFWNTAAGQAHPALSALPSADRIVSAFIGSTVGSAAASLVAKQIGYGPSFGEDGSLVASTTALANGYGLEWGEMLTTGKQTFASGTQNGTSIDLGSVSTLFGAAGYLHAFSLGSGTPTVTIQDSANDTDFLAVTGMGFTAITAATSERVQGAVGATVRRYVRIQVTGTYTALVCAVAFVRYLSSSAA